jgi:hypothetical protein
MPISQINTNSLGALAITTSQIANNAVTAAQVANNTIGTPQLNNLTSANVSQINTSTGTPSFTTVANGINVGGGILGAGNASTMKNRIINGAMVIDQRNAGASVTVTNIGDVTYGVDRWSAYGNVASKFSIQQNAGSVTPPAGFTNYWGVTSLSAYSVAAGDLFLIRQNIEGYNVADLDYGKSTAKTITLSFWVRSSLTGTFAGSVCNSAQNRSYPFTYTISAANTWEQKSVTITGDTSGTWLTTNGIGLQLTLSMGFGSTYNGTAGAWAAGSYFSVSGSQSVVGTSGATFYITGVQLEVGSSATGFEYRQYGTELALCQRYYTALYDFYLRGYTAGGTTIAQTVTLPTQMRTNPTLTKVGTWSVSNGGQPTVGSESGNSIQSFYLALSPSGAGDTYAVTGSSSTYVTASAEL